MMKTKLHRIHKLMSESMVTVPRPLSGFHWMESITPFLETTNLCYEYFGRSGHKIRNPASTGSRRGFGRE